MQESGQQNLCVSRRLGEKNKRDANERMGKDGKDGKKHLVARGMAWERAVENLRPLVQGGRSSAGPVGVDNRNRRVLDSRFVVCRKLDLKK